jgi:hypothetical protein
MFSQWWLRRCVTSCVQRFLRSSCLRLQCHFPKSWWKLSDFVTSLGLTSERQGFHKFLLQNHNFFSWGGHVSRLSPPPPPEINEWISFDYLLSTPTDKSRLLSSTVLSHTLSSVRSRDHFVWQLAWRPKNRGSISGRAICVLFSVASGPLSLSYPIGYLCQQVNCAYLCRSFQFIFTSSLLHQTSATILRGRGDCWIFRVFPNRKLSWAEAGVVVVGIAACCC